jgi:raffinose/stachyose/melibiose transport system permease protein
MGYKPNRTGKMFFLFILPALALYALFFLYPLIQGVQYSFTDWNGITPEIPASMAKADFENKVLSKVKPDAQAYLIRYYKLDDSGDNYMLQQWIVEKDWFGVEKTRKLGNGERHHLKSIFASLGMSNIKFIGWDNFKEVFTRDERFVPRIETRFLYKDGEDLPETISGGDFREYLLKNVSNDQDRTLLSTAYQPVGSGACQLRKTGLDEGTVSNVKTILARDFHKKVLNSGVIGFTLFFTFFNVIGCNLLALFLAIMLDREMRTKNALRSIFFLPNVLSLIIVAFVWSFIFNNILPRITPVQIWLGNPDVAPWGILMVTIWQGAGYLMVIYLAGLQGIPKEVVECAELDGANSLQRFWNITIPMILPSLTICLFYSLAGSLKMFDAIYALTGGGPGYSTTPIVLDIYNNAFVQNRFGYGTAKAILLCVIIMAVTGIQLFAMKRKEIEL